tara:strand:+ start:787 stop:2184 length:1398 start_codon:yes stop_codon:yes gene_type:complete
MPNYRPVTESIGAGPSNIDVDYEVGTAVSLSYPVGTYDPNTLSYINVGTATANSNYRNKRYYLLPGSTFRQTWKVPNGVSIDSCDSSGQTWYVDSYSDPNDRIVYLAEDLTESLNGEYTGCCFDENGNQVPEPSLNQKRVTNITLEGIQFDTYGKILTASGIEYKNGCTTVAAASVVRSETFTVTFDSMVPNIASSAPYLDDDVTVTLERSDGTTVVATSSSGTVSMSATAPQTITIKFGGEFGKKLFPEETWEYYYEKNSEYTANPDHLNFEIDIPERGPDPNDYFEPYRIDKDNNSGSLNDLSQEVPSGVSLLGFESDITEREAGTNPIDGSTSRAGHRDIVFNFTVTSSIPALSTIAWALFTPIPTGSYCTNGGSTYYVEVGGTPSTGSPGAGIPADVGPSGTGFFIDNSGMRYRYIPPEGTVTTAGAGTWSTTLYVMNDYRIGAARFQELLGQATARRVKE